MEVDDDPFRIFFLNVPPSQNEAIFSSKFKIVGLKFPCCRVSHSSGIVQVAASKPHGWKVEGFLLVGDKVAESTGNKKGGDGKSDGKTRSLFVKPFGECQ
jgi:hypothetical protein